MKLQPILIAALLAVGCSTSKPAAEDDALVEEPAMTTELQATANPMKEQVIDWGRAATEAFFGGDGESLHARFSEEMVEALPADTWKQVTAKTIADLGPEEDVVEESSSKMLDNLMYYRTTTFEKVPGKKVVLTWAFRADGTITGFTITPHKEPAPSTKLEYQTKTPLRLPFDDEWTVIWGGRTMHQNYHAMDPTQRFALDILVTDSDHRTFEGDRTDNESYFAFGKEVLSPGDGKIIAVQSDVADNEPGVMNPDQLAGNYVLIDHGNGEYSLLAHFKQGSLEVKTGDQVKKGQLLGLCGNSGNSSEPHIHYHLQNSAEPLKGEGLPIQFEAATIDGERREDVELTQSQRVSPAE